MLFNILILIGLFSNGWAGETSPRTIENAMVDYQASKKQFSQLEQDLAAKNAEIQQLDAKITVAKPVLENADNLLKDKANGFAEAVKKRKSQATQDALQQEVSAAKKGHETAENTLKSLQNQRDTAFNQFQQLSGEIEKNRLKSNQLVEELLTIQFATTKEVEVTVNRVCHEEENLKQCKEKATEEAKKQALDQGVGLLVDSFSKLSFQNEQWNIDKKEIISEGSRTVSNLTWLEPLDIIKGAYVGKMKATVSGQIPPSLKQRLQIAWKYEPIKVDKPQNGMKGMSDMGGVSKEVKKEITNSIGMEFVLIPAGSFQMGERSEAHNVKIEKEFYLGKYEVTQKQWETIMGTNPSKFKGENRPVENVSWNDAQEFIKKLNDKEGTKKYRLPTEAEWEYAARAGSEKAFAFGDCLSTDQANYNGNYPWENCPKGEYRKETLPVGSLAKNGFGLFDMHGNVKEWTCSDYRKYSENNHLKCSNNNNARKSLRGGSWFFNADLCRSVLRYVSTPDERDDGYGFRVVCLIPLGR